MYGNMRGFHGPMGGGFGRGPVRRGFCGGPFGPPPPPRPIFCGRYRPGCGCGCLSPLLLIAAVAAFLRFLF